MNADGAAVNAIGVGGIVPSGYQLQRSFRAIVAHRCEHLTAVDDAGIDGGGIRLSSAVKGRCVVRSVADALVAAESIEHRCRRHDLFEHPAQRSWNRQFFDDDGIAVGSVRCGRCP